METKHTQGEWKAVELSKNRKIGDITHEVQFGTDGEVVCESVYGEANAKLIAAAPDLLEALNICVSLLKLEGWTIEYGAIVKAEQAIKKATT